MKNLFSKFSLKRIKAAKDLVKNEKGQGATEYILMLAVLIAVVFLAKDKIKGFVETKMNNATDASSNIFDH